MKIIKKPVELDYVEFSMYTPKLIGGKITIAIEHYTDGSTKKIICEKGFVHEYLAQCNKTMIRKQDKNCTQIYDEIKHNGKRPEN